MTERDEYIKFWLGVKEKADEVQQDYNNLSNTNKHRVDNAINSILRARTIAEIIAIANNQLR